MTVTMFFQPGCPYCRRADKIISELLNEHPEYKNVTVKKINELAEPALADKYDYWRVPSFFSGDKKLYEASPLDSAEKMRDAINGIFEAATKTAITAREATEITE